MHTRDITAVATAFLLLGALSAARIAGNIGLQTVNLLNERIFVMINGMSRFALVAHAAPFITHLADKETVAVLLIACALFSLWMKPLRIWVFGLVLTAGLVTGFIFVLKPIYHVNRPLHDRGLPIYYYAIPPWFVGTGPVPDDLVRTEHRDASFPSGHATIAFALAGVLWHARRWRWVALTLACLVGLSRILIGVHFPADIITGASLGFLIGFLIMHWLEGQGHYAEMTRRVLAKDIVE